MKFRNADEFAFLLQAEERVMKRGAKSVTLDHPEIALRCGPCEPRYEVPTSVCRCSFTTAMILDASCQLTYQTNEDVAVIFMLRPRSGGAQSVLRQEFNLSPKVPMLEFADVYGNLCQRVIMPIGEFQISVNYRVDVADCIDVNPDAPLTPVELLPTDTIQFLLPSRYCQSDRLSDLARSIVGDLPASYQQVQAIHDWVRREIRYVMDSSDASTSALETLESRCGVCRDYAHLGITLCRAMSIPARMVVGFLHELEPMDLHAWFEAFIGGRWYAFDATQVQTKGNRIVIAYGRDAADVALATIFGDFSLVSMRVKVKPGDDS